MLIPWSGGLDSTMVLWNALEYWYGNRNASWCVHHGEWGSYELSQGDSSPRALTVECPTHIHPKQEEMQRKAVKALKKVFDHKKWVFDHGTAVLTPPKGLPYSGLLAQPLMWLTQAALIVQDKEPLLMGWIRGDDATGRLGRMAELWRQLTLANGKTSELLVPLRYECKQDVIRMAKEHGVLRKCWYCENPTNNGRPCKRCVCCETMIGAQAITEARKGRPPPGRPSLSTK